MKREFAKIQSKPFALLDPQLLLGSEEDQPCSDHCQLHSYFPHVEATLEQEVAHRGPMDEGRAWFLLNELSKGLELLGDNEQAHWGISPDTIFVNSYGNYYIHKKHMNTNINI